MGRKGVARSNKKGGDSSGQVVAPDATNSKKACRSVQPEEAATKWNEYSVKEQERFLATLDTELAQIIKSLSKAKDLGQVVDILEKIQIAALASLHQHSQTAGAKHTHLRRAFQLSEQATRFLESVMDVVTDRHPSLAPSVQKLIFETQKWTKQIVSAFGDTCGAGPKVVPTRGKTAPGRLRSLDAFICQYMRETLPKISDALVVDLGFGEIAVTTVELAHMLWRLFPDVHIIGVESSRSRAEKAVQNWKDQTPDDLRIIAPNLSRNGRWTCRLEGKMEFRHGGFLMPLSDVERQKLYCVKAMNVLRQYESLNECRDAYRTIASQLVDNGLLFEGSSDPSGKVVVCYVLRSSGNDNFNVEAMFFYLNLHWQSKSGGLSLDLIADNLPQLLFKRNVKNYERFLQLWREAAVDTKGRDIKEHFLEAARRLSEVLPTELGAVVLRKKWLRRGWLVLRNPNSMM